MRHLSRVHVSTQSGAQIPGLLHHAKHSTSGHIHTLTHNCCHRSFCKKWRERERGKKRGRMLQWQTQSVMQDYCVSFSTAIDVVFMLETQSFSKCCGPYYPCSYWRQRQRAEEGRRDFPPAIFVVWWLLSPSDHEKTGGGGSRRTGVPQLHPSH